MLVDISKLSVRERITEQKYLEGALDDPEFASLFSLEEIAVGFYGGSNGHIRIDKIIESEYPKFDDCKSYYGVADNIEQIMEHFKEEFAPDFPRRFVVFCFWVVKSEQSSWGGWRWHKWGEYIGQHEITAEYIYDEPVVDEVICFHVYEVKV